MAVSVLALGIGALTLPAAAAAGHRPIGAVQDVRQGVGGIHLAGWVIDPDAHVTVAVTITMDATATAPIKADKSNAATAGEYPHTGTHHGFDTTIAAAAGAHRVCLSAADVNSAGAATGTAAGLGCYSVTVDLSATGRLSPVLRPVASTTITVSGWAADPETNAPIWVLVTVDKAPAVRVRADQKLVGARVAFAGMGALHKFSVVLPVSKAAHRVCVTAVNVGAGTDTAFGCQTSPAMAATVPSGPRAATAVALNSAARVSWRAPATTGNTPFTGYRVTASPGGRTVTAAAGAQSATVSGLMAGTAYTFTVTATNLMGTSVASAPTAAVTPTAAAIGAVTTPALISTSRYIRNIYGTSADAVRTRKMGVADGRNNPANHRYLTLLQIGGQTTKGVVLSATSTYVTYGEVVSAMKAYIDGYASTQQSNAPALIAIGTNNDMDVRKVTGAIWATSVVNPLRTYAKKYHNITIAGANDIEPGFLGTVLQSKAWLQGYLGATTAKFVFNGSADGCGWTRTHTKCNNGWWATNLQWLSGGAAPTRILSLPQIYNQTMPKQWKYISLTGISVARKKVSFAGPLTEWTACYEQRGGCGSLTNNTAWSALWAQLRSDPRTSQNSLPYGTDLRIN